MRKLFPLLFLVLSLPGFSQEWININNPFKDPTPTPRWKAGDYIEIIYELDLRSSPDTSDIKDWVTINDVRAIKLATEFSIGSRSYKVDHPGMAVSNGNFRFRLYGPDFDDNQSIKKKNWKFITNNLFYSIKDKGYETKSVKHTNDAYVGTEGTIIVNRTSYITSDKQFEVEISSSHKQLSFDKSKISTSDGGNVISKYISQSGPVEPIGSASSSYVYKLRFGAKDGYDIIKVSAENGHRVFVTIIGSSATNKNFAQFEGIKDLHYPLKLKIQKVEGTTVKGSNPGYIRLTTSLPSNAIKLIFEESPYTPAAPLIINGSPLSSLPSNIFQFKIDSEKDEFQYGKFQFHFEGKSHLNNPIEKIPFDFEKSEIAIGLTTIVQSGNECKISIEFEQESQGTPKIVFVQTEDVRTMKQSPSKKTEYDVSLNLTDQFIEDNLITKSSDKYLNIYVNAFGKDYNKNGIKVNVLDKNQAAKDLEGIEGRKKKKKEKIKKYLEDNNFVGNTERMTEEIFSTLAKKKEDRDWSGTWESVGKFLKPAAGLLMLLL